MLPGKRTWSRNLVLLIGAIELMVFARVYRPSFDLADVRRPQLESDLKNQHGDFRVFDLSQENYPLGIGAYDMWGYDPTALFMSIVAIPGYAGRI